MQKTIKVSDETYELLKKIKETLGVPYARAVDMALKEKYLKGNK